MPMSTKRKAPGRLAAPVVKPSVKPITKSIINESRSSVAGTDAIVQNPQHETIEISSGPDSDEDVSDEDESIAEVNGGHGKSEADGSLSQANGQVPGRSGSAHREAEAEGSDEEATSPSFGELLRGSEAIDVPSLLQSSAASNALRRPAQTNITPPSHQSLTTVLTQALRTDDNDLLESCLHIKDLDTIRNTIERIDSLLAGTLLNKLASRLYRRPGRAGSLMTWVQWTLVAHGGAIASQPKVLHGLGGLQKVLAERAKGLNSLLALKGKLDMLESQMDLRRRMQRRLGAADNGDDSDVDEDVIWVEGEANETDTTKIGSRRRQNIDDEDDIALGTNGFIGDSDDEEENDDDADEEEDEAEDDSLDEDEVDHEDVDDSMAEDDESDAEPAPPAKVQKVTRSFSKRK